MLKKYGRVGEPVLTLAALVCDGVHRRPPVADGHADGTLALSSRLFSMAAGGADVCDSGPKSNGVPHPPSGVSVIPKDSTIATLPSLIEKPADLPVPAGIRRESGGMTK